MSLRSNRSGLIAIWIVGIIMLLTFGLGYWVIAAPVSSMVDWFSGLSGLDPREKPIMTLGMNIFVWCGYIFLFGVLLILAVHSRKKEYVDVGY